MVTILNFDVPNLYIGGAVGGIFVLFLIWYLFLRGQGGRLGEEKEEERETERLETDEKTAEQAQKDEKKACVIMIKIVRQIQDSLRTGGRGEVYDQVLSESGSISVMLWRMRDEKMSVKRAIETFKELHAKLNEFIAKLPKDNKTVNGLVDQLLYYQKREYSDLIKELQMDNDKKDMLKKLWVQETDEETGTGNAAA
ncbi:MAG: hypothetical protein AABX25_03335 [Nanoarchaeota archaeon]